LDGSDESIARTSRNIPLFNIMRAQDVNAYDIMRNKKLLVTKTALINLLERVKK
ncbi:MAG: 50S ribosomal protein L4, partial [Candidatus Omnitrophica bacterium]|nr:50S ribosomal protein L4 [Candidatus Omnitrophota bacterium]